MYYLFEMFVSNWQHWQNFSAEKAFLRKNLSSYVYGTEDHGKLKSSILSIFLRKKTSKIVSYLNVLLASGKRGHSLRGQGELSSVEKCLIPAWKIFTDSY